MARIAGEAKVEKREWTLVFKTGWQRRLRIEGFFAGHDTKDGLKARLTNDQVKLNVDEGNGPNLKTYITSEPVPSDSISKTGVEFRNYNRSVFTGRSIEPPGSGQGSPLSPPTPAVLWSGGRGRKTNGGGVEDLTLSRVRDVVLARELEDFRGSSWFSPTSAAENRNKRRKFAAAADQLLPVLTPKVPVRGLLSSAAAEQYSGDSFAVSPYMGDEESETSSDSFSEIRNEVDNFVIHASHKLVSVTVLPVYIDGVLTGGASPAEKVYLVGTVGPDCLTFKQRVEMWRLVLDPPHRPRYLLKTKKGVWVRLLNPHEDYSDVMSDVLALGNFLNFVKKLPDASPMAAEQALRKTCSRQSAKPPLRRLSRYIKVIRSFIDEDSAFARAPILREIFPDLFSERSSLRNDEEFESEHRQRSAGETGKGRRLLLKSEMGERKEKRYKVMAKKDVHKPRSFKASTPDLQSEYDSDYELKKLKKSHGVKRSLIDGVHLRWDDDSGTKYQPETDLGSNYLHKRMFTLAEVNVEDPPICIICDDGGDLIYCDGPCHRHFHPTKGSGESSSCKTLGMTEAEVETMGKFYCPNCKHKQQQCFICGDLGSSVRTSDGPQEVRRCDISFCKRFFHVECVARTLCPPELDWRDLVDDINAGDKKLYCPRHCCSVCGKKEIKESGMLVQCRRCPKAWHRECLVNFPKSMEKSSVRIWRQHDREFIYCRDHKILPKIQTPARDHLRFPAPR